MFVYFFHVGKGTYNQTSWSPTTHDQSVYHARTHFREKRVFFQWEAQIGEIKKKGPFFMDESAIFWKMYLFSLICSALLNRSASIYMSFNHTFEVIQI